MLRFIISVMLIFSHLMANAQLFQKLEEGRKPFVRVSFDPTVSLKRFLQEANMSGFEATIDSEIRQNLFVIGGLGLLNCNFDYTNFDYTNTGIFGMIGADLNLSEYKNPDDRNIFFIGLRYGLASLSHEAGNVVMDNYWGEYATAVERESHSAGWVELAMGIKAELTKNMFIGWTGEAKFRTHISSGKMTPYCIPGFGKNKSSFAFDLNFFVAYAFSFKRQTKAAVEN